jgi:hypothetical protein
VEGGLVFSFFIVEGVEGNKLKPDYGSKKAPFYGSKRFWSFAFHIPQR